MKQTVQLENLSCQNCVKHVTKHFLSMEGVSDVAVDLEKQTAQVTTDKSHSTSDYEAALAKTIYKVVSVD
ncbi:heavy-metal-associated domain-containing protein [Streptococcus gordonii]|uniref:heavy-metal-associated domain-containing protein n=1 Tax=Streptococcus gordonii TaxID=1302 RepID=UPI001CBB8C9C|nr:heavy metal-associated domain-containing protein [Streptococcus gordonii]MBZ2133739.1 heavy-metal-associated domain-containing protein [Streptococcus gordonii]MBZ2142207.1 heavy-metal-associated domain-containing protein [Streptococcus gordonii]MBZ2144021.1 heavy-metal-associated domain-containing protein [Streptococcus gordonii]MBZ2146126.1 heavy-metal-associated domain-containing protein [Streptococcus gordonii]